MVAALLFDPPGNVCGPPPRGDDEVRPRQGERRLLRALQAQPRCAEGAKQNVMQMNEWGKT